MAVINRTGRAEPTSSWAAFQEPSGVTKPTLWLSRFMLAAPTFIFTMIAARYLFDPVKNAASTGIVLATPLGVTIGRVGLGGIPLAIAIMLFACLLSPRRHLAGLYALAITDLTILVVRTIGVSIDHTGAQNIGLFVPEIVLLTLSSVAIWLQLRDRRNVMAARSVRP